MKGVKAIICDVYRTLLDIREEPVDMERRWGVLFRSCLRQDSFALP